MSSLNNVYWEALFSLWESFSCIFEVFFLLTISLYVVDNLHKVSWILIHNKWLIVCVCEEGGVLSEVGLKLQTSLDHSRSRLQSLNVKTCCVPVLLNIDLHLCDPAHTSPLITLRFKLQKTTYTSVAYRKHTVGGVSFPGRCSYARWQIAVIIRFVFCTM